LALLFSHAPCLREAVDLRDELTAPFNEPLTRKQAILRLSGWAARVKRSSVQHYPDPFEPSMSDDEAHA